MIVAMQRLPNRMLLVGAFLAGQYSACSGWSLHEDGGDWRHYLGGLDSSQYSTLSQINVENVSRLKVAWEYHTGETFEGLQSQIQCNPIIVEGRMYVLSARTRLIALEAATGQELWTFDPFSGSESPGANQVSRGVHYWQEEADRRVLFVARSRLYAIDADTGRPAAEFGQGGSVDLHQGLSREDPNLFVTARTPGVVYKDLLILGSTVSEGPDAAPGDIRAYDVRTGRIRWVFHTIPLPGEYGYETWPEEAWKKVGGANSWAGMSLDIKRGIVYIPTGSPAFDFYGGNRIGQNLFGNCLLALKAETGERVWHFQTVHHDLWDRDLPAPPNLVTLRRNGRVIEAVAQITKSGHVFVFDRDTGTPLFPVEERPVPRSDLKGEVSWSTQPFPLQPPPFARQLMSEADLTDRTPEVRQYVLERFRSIRSGGQFVPPSTEGTLIFPGFDGGGEWGGAAHDPESGILYVNANEMPWILTMVDIQGSSGRTDPSLGQQVYTLHCAGCHGTDRQGAGPDFPPLTDLQERVSRQSVYHLLETGSNRMPPFQQLSAEMQHAVVDFLFGREDDALPSGESQREIDEQVKEIPYTFTGYHRFFDPEGYPAVKPPWGTLNAIDLNRGEILWKIPLGEFPELSAEGIPPTGAENYGGPIVTAGGLLFIAATRDEKFRAFDKQNGKLLWETTLPAGGYATPATYQVNGRQFVVIAAGGGKMGTPPGDSFVAFVLPEN